MSKIFLDHELNGIEVPVNGNVKYYYAIMIKEKIILLHEAKKQMTLLQGEPKIMWNVKLDMGKANFHVCCI